MNSKAIESMDGWKSEGMESTFMGECIDWMGERMDSIGK